MTNKEKLTALQAESFKAYQKFCAEHECGTCPYRTDDGYSCVDGFWVDYMLEHGVRAYPDKTTLHRLGKFGTLFMERKGCPRGAIGEFGEGVSLEEAATIMPAIEDMDGNRWVPVLENVLEQLLRHAKREG